MNKPIALAFGFLALSALASCREQSSSSASSSSIPSPTSKISLFSAKSRLVVSSMDDAGSKPLATYRHVDYGDAPYIELGEFFQSYADVGFCAPGVFEKVDDHLYAFSQNGIIIATFNPSTDIVTIRSFDSFIVQGNANNLYGVNWDTGNPKADPRCCVHPGAGTKFIGEVKPEVYDFGAYHFELEEIDGKVYCPFDPIHGLLTRQSTFDCVYNGHDFVLSLLLNDQMSIMYPGPYSTAYATVGEFGFGGKLFTKSAPVGDEVYRYCAQNKDGYAFFCFFPDGKVELRKGSSKTDPGTPQFDPSSISMSYVENEDGIYVKSITSALEIDSTFLLPSTKTYFNTKTRSPSVASYTYDVLRFSFENTYGLKEELFAKHKVDSFDALIDAKGLKSRLLSTDSETYDEALCELLMGSVDDGHTRYTGRSVFSGIPTDGVKELALEKQGPRRKGLLDKLTAYKDYRTEVLGPEDAEGVFFEGKTAVIRFDAFTATGEILNVKSGSPLPEGDPALALKTSTPDGFYLAFKEIEKHPEVENVVIDLTCNGGGVALTLPYLAATWTDDPTFRLHDTCLDAIREFHYQVDFNRNGIFGEEEDTYKGKYEFFLLTSGFSFSCGNALPTMAYADGVTVIGERSGGGACPVASVSDGSGTIYNTSMPIQISYPDGKGGYVNNDSGVPIEEGCELPIESWYDLKALDAFVSKF